MRVVYIWGNNQDPTPIDYFTKNKIDIAQIACVGVHFFALKKYSKKVYRFSFQYDKVTKLPNKGTKQSPSLAFGVEKTEYLTSDPPTRDEHFTIFKLPQVNEEDKEAYKEEYFVQLAADCFSLYALTNMGRLFTLAMGDRTPYTYGATLTPLNDTFVVDVFPKNFENDQRYNYVVDKLFASNLGVSVIMRKVSSAKRRTTSFVENDEGCILNDLDLNDEYLLQENAELSKIVLYRHYSDIWRTDCSLKNLVQPEDSIVSIAGDSESMIVVTDMGHVFYRGHNPYGMLGDSKSSIYEFQEWRSYPKDTDPNSDSSTDRFVSAHMGKTHTLMRTMTGCVYTIGRDFVGLYTKESLFDDQTPRLERYLSSIINVTCSDIHRMSVVVPYDGDLYLSARFTEYHNMALTESGSVFGWGYNKLGQVGSCWDRNYTIFPTLVEALYGQKVIQISSGYQTSACLADQPIETYGALINNELFSDKTFRIGDDTVYAHNCILLARCPLLLALIECNLLNRVLCSALSNLDQVPDSAVSEEPNPTTVHISSEIVSLELFLRFLTYLYADDATTIKEETTNASVEQLLSLAKLFHYLDFSCSPLVREEKVDRHYVSSLASILQEKYGASTLEQLRGMIAQAYQQTVESSDLLHYGSRCARLIELCANMAKLPESIVNNPLDNTFSKHMMAIFNSSDTFSDWIIVVQKPTEGTENILVHKAILSTKMDFFRAALTGGNFESTLDTFEIMSSFQSHTIVPMLAYAYTERADLLDETNTCESLVCADYFSYPSYKRVVEHTITSYLDDSTIFPLLNVCAYNNAFFLRERCFVYMIDNYERLAGTKLFRKIPTELKEAIEKRAAKSGKKAPSVATTNTNPPVILPQTTVRSQIVEEPSGFMAGLLRSLRNTFGSKISKQDTENDLKAFE